MQKSTKVLITFIFLILLVTFLYFFTDWFSKVTGFFIGEAEKEKLALCLEEKNAEFYTADFCAECEKQKKLFGNSFKKIFSVNCGKDKEFCPNIREIPAWYINKSFHYGFKNLTELKKISGCE